MALALLAIGLMASASGPVHASLALLGAILLLRRDGALVLAPVYGAGLLLAGELAQRCAELQGGQRLGPGVARMRLVAILSLAALGACVSAVAALAVTVAPSRSIATSAAATVAVAAIFAAIVLLARRATGRS